MSLSTCTYMYTLCVLSSAITTLDVSSACSTASQKSEQMMASRQTIEHSVTTTISASLAKQSTEQCSSQKKEMATITQNAEPSITSYATYLRGIYTSISQSHTSQHWTYLPRCEFVQLAMIGDEKLRRGGPEEEMIRLAQQGKIETIISQKQQIDLENIFPPPPEPPPTPPPPPPSPSTEHPMPYQLNEHSQPNIDISMLPTLKQRVVLIEGAPGGGKSTLALHICHKWAQGANCFYLNLT